MKFLPAVAIALLPHLAWAACSSTVTVKDGNGATQNFCIGVTGGNFISNFNLVDSTGANIASVSGGALKVDNSGVTQPVSGTVTANAGSGTFTVSGTVTANAGTNLNTSTLALESGGNLATVAGAVSGSKFQDNIASAAAGVLGQGATGSAVPANAVQIGGNGSGNLTAPVVCDQYTPFSLASTTSLKVIAKATGKNVYLCSINIVSGSANNVALLEGTKTTTDCDTSTAGMAGGTTAATGWNFAANGGLTLGSGLGVVAKTASTGHDVCLLASGSGQLSGGMAWTQF